MKKTRTIILLLVTVMCISALGGCSRLDGIRLPPLPTPGDAGIAEDGLTIEEPSVSFPPASQTIPQPASDPFTERIPESVPTVVSVPPDPTPSLEDSAGASAEPALPPAEPTPAASEIVTENPNAPHLFIDGATYPESMGQGGIAMLVGQIYVDKGVIVQVVGKIIDENGNNIQQCVYYPYVSNFSLAGTVNAELVFGLLEPGDYRYIVSAIAENNSYTNGEEILIDHPFTIYYP